MSLAEHLVQSGTASVSAVADSEAELLKAKIEYAQAKSELASSQPQAMTESTESGSVSIVGEIRRPGKIAWSKNLSFLQALALAGGLTAFADTDQVKLRRDQREQSFDLKAIAIQPLALQPGDVIIVPHRGRGTE